VHMRVLLAVHSVQPAPVGTSLEGMRAVRLPFAAPSGSDPGAALLSNLVPGLSDMALRFVCAELIARGLLHDQGIGGWGGAALEYATPTEFCDWFVNWIGI
jgi:hypothetical protein